MSIWTRIAEALSALASGESLAAIFDKLRAPPERSVAFAIAVIALGAKMAKADGLVTRNEVTAFREVFHIPKDEEQNAARVFNLARQDAAGFESYARRISTMFEGPDGPLSDLMEGLFHIAVADGAYHPAEDEFLAEVARIFGFDARTFGSIRARFVPDAERDPYDVLGVSPGAELEEVRAAWRQLVRESHPDRMLARGVPEEAVKLAEKRLVAFNRAWEQIAEARGSLSLRLRLATYNVEWFDHLFDDAGELFDDDGPSGRFDVTRREQTRALAEVFRALDADAILVVEGPDISRRRDGRAALRGFAERAGLRARSALAGFANDTRQELLLLYDPDRVSAVHDPRGWPPGTPGAGSPRFDGRARIDLDEDGIGEEVAWSKPPLEARLRLGAVELRLIGVHAKSKAPIGARTPEAMVRLAALNRRKQLAQCVWLRERVVEHLDGGESLVVLGDFNDGPGLDSYEQPLGRSSIEVVMGAGAPPGQRLQEPHAHAALAGPMGAQPATARFRVGESWLSALLDYVMVSPDLMSRAPRWQIWHPFDHRGCYGDLRLRQALLHASDHFPVTLDLDL